MRYTKIILLVSVIVLLNACGKRKLRQSSQYNYYHQGIYFGRHVTPTYKAGVRDGCQTAKGFYKKDSRAFNQQIQPMYGDKKYYSKYNTYHNGWFMGRNKCRKLLVLDDKSVMKKNRFIF
jgi:hypothetical protein